jgi:hypothetical protein
MEDATRLRSLVRSGRIVGRGPAKRERAPGRYPGRTYRPRPLLLLDASTDAAVTSTPLPLCPYSQTSEKKRSMHRTSAKWLFQKFGTNFLKFPSPRQLV